MRWASSIQTTGDTEQAVIAASERIEAALGGRRADLLLAFATPHHAHQVAAIPALLRQRFSGAAVLGGTAPGVIGEGQELEEGPGLSVLAAHLPDVEARVFHLDAVREPPTPAEWQALVGLDPVAAPALILLPEPRGLPIDPALAALDAAYPHSPKLGAIVGAAAERSPGALFAEGFVQRRGLVGLALTGDVELHPAIAQGGRPIGAAFTITEAHDNVVRALDGQPALGVLTEVYASLSALDQALFRAQPLVGIGAEPGGGAADLLVRNLIGTHEPTGSFAVAHRIAVGQELRFVVRDADSARRDLAARLAGLPPPGAGSGAVLFSCVGRGRRFYGKSNQDTRAIQRAFPSTPVGGAFVGGELGPVRGQTALHAYTAAAGLFSPGSWS